MKLMKIQTDYFGEVEYDQEDLGYHKRRLFRLFRFDVLSSHLSQ